MGGECSHHCANLAPLTLWYAMVFSGVVNNLRQAAVHQLLMHCSLPEIRLHFSIVFSTSGRRCLLVESRIQEILSCGIWNSGLWNPEPHCKNWDLESNSHFLESSTRNPESTSWTPESKSSLGFTYTRHYGYSHPFLKLTTPLISSVFFFSKSNHKITLFSQSILTFYG